MVRSFSTNWPVKLKHRAYNETQENLVQFLDQKSFYSVESTLHAKISVKFFVTLRGPDSQVIQITLPPQIIKLTEGLLYK
jgi:hypothetical protein